MKFNKIKNVAFFSKYIREDGKYTIETKSQGSKGIYIVTDENGNLIETCKKLKEAKEKYSL